MITVNTSRNSHQRRFVNKSVPKNFTKFTGKQLFRSLFFNNVAGFRPVTLLKEKLQHRCFPVNFVKLFKNPFSIEHLRATASVHSTHSSLVESFSLEQLLMILFFANFKIECEDSYVVSTFNSNKRMLGRFSST